MSWGYRACSSCPPEKWQNNFEAGKGSSQSPINIQVQSENNLKSETQLTPLKVNYNSKESAKSIVNNGHSVQVAFDSGCSISGLEPLRLLEGEGREAAFTLIHNIHYIT